MGITTHPGRTQRICAVLLLCALLVVPARAAAQDAATLQARHDSLRTALDRNQFGRPLYLESREADSTLQGDVYAVIAQPYAVVGPALATTEHWCEILMLHENIKQCRAAPAEHALVLNIGRKFDQPLADTYLFEFVDEVTSTPEYLHVALSAAAGPLGTSHYRVVLEAVTLDAGRTFLHLSYAYDHSLAARWAQQVYLATIGRAKAGFSIVGERSGGRPEYIGGTRGMVERNAMRCHLAMEAYLGTLAVPAAERIEQRLHDFHAATERHPLQLHEVPLDQYLAMKHREIRRQQAPDPVTAAEVAVTGGPP